MGFCSISINAIHQNISFHLSTFQRVFTPITLSLTHKLTLSLSLTHSLSAAGKEQEEEGKKRQTKRNREKTEKRIDKSWTIDAERTKPFAMDIYFARFELNQSLHKVPSNKLWSKHDGTKSFVVYLYRRPAKEKNIHSIEFHWFLCIVLWRLCNGSVHSNRHNSWHKECHKTYLSMPKMANSYVHRRMCESTQSVSTCSWSEKE